MTKFLSKRRSVLVNALRDTGSKAQTFNGENLHDYFECSIVDECTDVLKGKSHGRKRRHRTAGMSSSLGCLIESIYNDLNMRFVDCIVVSNCYIRQPLGWSD